MAKILIVDDEADLVELLRFNLSKDGHDVTTAATGARALDAALAGPPEVAILDAMLPDMSGFEVCRELRRQPPTASAHVLMLSARTAEADRLLGFSAGADDYVTKPFSVTELVMRVRAAARRPPPPAAPLEWGPLRVEAATQRFFLEGREVALTALEFRLLHLLIAAAGRVVSREALLDQVWGAPGSPSRTLDSHVLRLRAKLGGARALLQTVRGVGYRLRAP